MCYSANGFTVVTFESWTSPENLACLNPYSTIQLAFSQTCVLFFTGGTGILSVIGFTDNYA
jgi:hypothetical protein